MHRPDTPGCYTASAPDVLAILHAAPGHTPGRQYRRHIHQEPLMNRNTAYLAASAVAAALAIGALSGAAQAQSKPEKCFGVAKPGKNDCQTAHSSCPDPSQTAGPTDVQIGNAHTRTQH